METEDLPVRKIYRIAIMRNRGQQNRFNREEKKIWMGWDECLRCGENRWDALHHIITPTDFNIYSSGKHNTSMLNSCPIHNYPCHIGEDSKLHDMIGELLVKSKHALTEWQDYELTELDYEFLDNYGHLYGELPASWQL